MLTRAVLVARAEGADAHTLKGKADLAADVFALVGGGNIEISRPVVGYPGRLARLAELQKIEGLIEAHLGGLSRALEHIPRVGDDGRAVGIENVAEEVDDPAVLRAPRELGER